MIRASIKNIEEFEKIENDFLLGKDTLFRNVVNDVLVKHSNTIKNIKEQLEYDDGKRPYKDGDSYSLITSQYVNNKIVYSSSPKQNINFANQINEQHTNMFVGHAPVVFQNKPNKGEQTHLVDFNMSLIVNNWQKIFYEVVRTSCACGYGYMLAHNRAKDEYARFASLSPLDTCVACDKTIDPESLFAIYRVKDNKNYVHYVYTNKYIYTFEGKKDLVLGEYIDKTRHYFGRVPITEFKNNERGVGDAFFSLGLINMYSATLNDGIKGFRQMMESLLVFKNIHLGSAEEQATAKEIMESLNVFSFSVNPGEEADVYYVETKYDINAPKEILSLLETKIFQMSDMFNFYNPSAVQSMGAPALKLMMKPYLDKAMAKEPIYTPKLKRVFKCAMNYADYNNKGFKLDIDKIDIIYSHPLPSNDQEAITNIVNLGAAGMLNKKQALRTISWVKNYDEYFDGIEIKSDQEIIDDINKKAQGTNEYNLTKQKQNPQTPEQNDNAANNSIGIGQKLIDPNQK